MIDKRRKPRPSGPSRWKPSSSGPRWNIAVAIRRIVSGSTGCWLPKLYCPQIPHILRDLRGGSKSALIQDQQAETSKHLGLFPTKHRDVVPNQGQFPLAQRSI